MPEESFLHRLFSQVHYLDVDYVPARTVPGYNGIEILRGGKFVREHEVADILLHKAQIISRAEWEKLVREHEQMYGISLLENE